MSGGGTNLGLRIMCEVCVCLFKNGGMSCTVGLHHVCQVCVCVTNLRVCMCMTNLRVSEKFWWVLYHV